MIITAPTSIGIPEELRAQALEAAKSQMRASGNFAQQFKTVQRWAKNGQIDAQTARDLIACLKADVSAEAQSRGLI